MVNHWIRSKKGFTLLEILIVIIIVGILATLAIPRYRKVVERGKQVEANNTLGTIRHSLLRYAEEKGSYTTIWANLDVEQPTPGTGTARYFTFSLLSTAVYPAAPTTPIAQATRNTVQNPGYGAYTLTIQQNGDIIKSAGAP